eukprot:522306_1
MEGLTLSAGVGSAGKETGKLLSELHAACRVAAGPNGPFAAEQHIGGLREVLLAEDLSTVEEGLCMAVLLKADSPNNIPTLFANLMKNTSYTKEIKVRIEIARFLKDYVKHLGERLKPCAGICQKLFFQVIRADSSNSVKDQIFLALNALLSADILKNDQPDGMPMQNIVESFLRQLKTARSKISGTVRGHFLATLGLLAERHTDLALWKLRAPELALRYTKALELERTEVRDVQRQVVEGIFRGLRHFLVDFPKIIPEDPKQSKFHCLSFIYEIIVLTTSNIEQQTRYNLCDAALKLLEAHIHLFKKSLLNDQGLVDRILVLCSHKNPDLRKTAENTLAAVVSQLSGLLIENKVHSAAAKLFKSLWTRFHTMLRTKRENSESPSLPVRILGLLAAPVRVFTNERNLADLLVKLMEMNERMSQGFAADVEAPITHFPYFLETFSQIIKELETIDPSVLMYLSAMIGRLLRTFPLMHSAYRAKNLSALTGLFVVLYTKGSVFRQVLESVVPTGLRLSIMNLSNNGVPVAVGYLLDGDFKDYVSLWSELLSSSNMEWDRKLGGSPQLGSHLESMRLVLYDALVLEMINVMRQLDLRIKACDTSSSEDSKSSGAPSQFGLSARFTSQNPLDFNLFLNLVELCKLFLPVTMPERFPKWAVAFGYEIIKQSNTSQLVSGFYKLMQLVFEICAKQQPDFFSECMSTEEDDNQLMDADKPDSGFNARMFASYLARVRTRLQQYTDDLLLACLQLVLCAPSAFSSSESLTEPIRTAFKLGISHLPAALLAMDALERCCNELRDSENVGETGNRLETFLKRVLPSLADFITTPKHIAVIDAAQRSRDARPGQRAHSRSMASDSAPLNEDGSGDEGESADVEESAREAVDPERARLTVRILKFLGSVGGMNSYLIRGSTDLNGDGENESSSQVVAWDIAPRVKYEMPFAHQKLEIWFDKFLPRICELAESSPHRRTKVASCESLHSIVVYMIMSHAKDTDVQHKLNSQTPFTRLYRHLFPVLLRLASDVETVAAQLFRPLVLQVIHWLTGAEARFTEEAGALLESVTECVGAAGADNAALREFAALCLAEFLKYSVKKNKVAAARPSRRRNNEPKKESVPTDVKSILRRLYSLAHHSNTFKRLGAALAFSHIYRQIREDQASCNKYILEMLLNMIKSLQLSENDDESFHTRSEISRVCEHFTKIISDPKHNVYMQLLENDSDRAGPEACHGLLGFTDMIFEMLSTSATHARRQCVVIFE